MALKATINLNDT